MDVAPPPRPGPTQALATVLVLAVLLVLLVYPAFQQDTSLATQGRSVAAWQQHFASHGWDAHAGMGQPRQPLPSGITGVCAWVATQTSNPGALFALGYPLICLLLLGLGAWYAVRQLGGSAAACGLGAVAAALSGVFFSRAIEFSPGAAAAGAALFLALGAALPPRLTWPRALVAGLALAVAVMELGLLAGAPLAVLTAVLARVLAHMRAEDAEPAEHGLPVALMIAVAVAVTLPLFNDLETHRLFPDQPLRAGDWLTLSVAGFHGFRMDALDSTLHHGTPGSGSAHAGLLVLLLGLWAVAQACRRNSAYAPSDQRSVQVLAVVAVLALVGTLAQPHWILAAAMMMLLLGALGLQGFDQWLGSKTHEKTRAFGGGGFNLTWRLGCLALFVAAAVGFLLHGARLDEADKEPVLVQSMLAESHWQLGMAVIFLFLSANVLIVCSLKHWTRDTRRIGLVIMGLVLAVELVLAGGPFVSFDSTSPSVTVNTLAEALKNRALGRLATLNEHQAATSQGDTPLDHQVIVRLLVPAPPRAEDRGDNPLQTRLPGAFFLALTNYPTRAAIGQFNRQTALLMRPPDQAALDTAVKAIRELPGGAALLQADGNGPVIRYITQTALTWERHLAALEAMEMLDERMALEDAYALAAAGVVRATRRDFSPHTADASTPAESLRLLLRQWELAGTRYILCHAGVPSLSTQVQERFDTRSQPIYQNALNQELDPARRRFRTVGAFTFTNVGSEEAPQLELAPTTNAALAAVSLMEFNGALPRAQLFADWKTGLNKARIREMLFSPGFNPHLRVLLGNADLPSPEQPSQTPRMSAPVIRDDRSGRVVLEIPPTDYAAVLMLNDAHDPFWSVTIDDQKAKLLRANGRSLAVHLPASAKARTVRFTYNAPHSRARPVSMAMMLILLLAAAGSWRKWLDCLKRQQDGAVSHLGEN